MKFRRMKLEDSAFVNFVRNGYAKKFLHDSRTFSLEETREWFSKTKPDFWMIEHRDEIIGYFRLSNHDKDDNSIYIGADIHPDHVGKGNGTIAYNKFMTKIAKQYKVKTFRLDVLASNVSAYNLYKKLGFEPHDIETMQKNGELEMSIKMKREV